MQDLNQAIINNNKNNGFKNSEVVYQVIDLTKVFPGITALSKINLKILRGEIHGIIGKNGAGKSTLVNIMYGAEKQSKGKIIAFGKEIIHLTPERAHLYGISLIPQKTEYPLDLNVADVLFLGKYPRSLMGFVNKRQLHLKARDILNKLGLTNISPINILRILSMEERRLIEVGRAIWCFNSEILIFDETTAALSFKSRNMLFEVLKRITSQENKTVIFITHRLEEIMEICDRISVLRDGKLVTTVNRKETTDEKLTGYIVGESAKVNRNIEIAETVGSVNSKKISSEVVFETVNLSKKNSFDDINLKGSRGEIVGIAGMVGSGKSELLRYMGGLTPKGGNGDIFIRGKKIIPKSPQEMLKNRVSYLTNNREEEGLFHKLPIENNLIGSKYVDYSNKIGIINQKKVKKAVISNTETLQISIPGARALIDVLSGGNKQKVMVGRLLNYGLIVYLFDEITDGIDVGVRKMLLEFLRKTLRKDAFIILASNIVSDLIEVCDRILVLYEGKMVKSFLRNNFNEHEIYSYVQGVFKSDREN